MRWHTSAERVHSSSPSDIQAAIPLMLQSGVNQDPTGLNHGVFVAIIDYHGCMLYHIAAAVFPEYQFDLHCVASPA